MQKIFFIFFLWGCILTLFAQQGLENSDPNYSSSDLIIQPSPQKSAHQAILMSAIFPGAGQYYVNKKTLLTYIFPVIEIGLWIGMNQYYREGDRRTKKFEAFANRYYQREDQYRSQVSILNQNRGIYHWDDDLDEWGNGKDFRLDPTKTQHYYEDIGKYDKYIFGWLDWQEKYADNSGNAQWIFSETDRWIGNMNLLTGQNDYFINTDLRKQYARMRQMTNIKYRQGDYFLFYILLNHSLATLDAYRQVKKYNSQQVYIQPNYSMVVKDSRLTPIVGLNLLF